MRKYFTGTGVLSVVLSPIALLKGRDAEVERVVRFARTLED